MKWDEDSRTHLETALNEANVLGLRMGPQNAFIDVLLHVSALPESGPIDPDARRALRLLSPSEVRILLRTDQTASDGYGTPIPLADLNEVEALFASLTWGDSMYGWKFFDNPDLVKDWPPQPSLTIRLQASPAAHTFYWFSECGRQDGDGTNSYCIEGTRGFRGPGGAQSRRHSPATRCLRRGGTRVLGSDVRQRPAAIGGSPASLAGGHPKVATLGVDRDDRDWCLAGVVRPEPGRGFGLAGSADDAYRRAPVVTDSAG